MKLQQVAAQFYTLREFCKTPADLAESARKVRAIGYQAVQVSGIGPIPAEEVRRIFDGEGLVICATHEPSDVIRKEPAKAIEVLKALGCIHTAYPFPAGVNFADPVSVNSLIDDLSRAGAALAAAGCVLSYHNHAIEFIRVGGKTILETIYERTDPRHLQGEPDTYWVQYGGADPVAWCRKLKGRLPLIHLKDYGFTPENKPTFAEVGNGNLDFPAIVAAAEESGCEWFIVEQDTCPGDPFDSLRMSFEYIKSHLVSA